MSPIPYQPLHELIDQAASTAEHARDFMVVGDQAMTYGELLDRMSRLYTLFDERLLADSAIAIVTRSPLDLASILLAALREQRAVVNLNPDMPALELRQALGATGADHVFIDRDIVDSAPLIPGLATTVLKGETKSKNTSLTQLLLGRRQSMKEANGFAADLQRAKPRTPRKSRDQKATSLLLFTSGTTQKPKVVQLSAENIASQVQTFMKVYDYDASARILNPLPLHFTDGLFHGPIITFLTSATLYRPRAFTFDMLEDLLHGIYRDRITHFIVVPALLSMIKRLDSAFDDAFDTPDFRFIRSSGDQLPEALWRAFQERFGVQVMNTYGLSETVCEALFCGPSDVTFRIGTIGKPIDCQIRISIPTQVQTESSDRAADADKMGELQIRGRCIMKGYLNQPELTAEAFDGDWLRTGDIAVEDQDGFVRIVGRTKSLIISGGVNVHPQNIVDTILEHEAVAEAFAFGIPDPAFGEVVACAVVLKPDAEFRDLTPEAMIQFCRSRLAAQKVPRVIKIMQGLPRNAAGKVLVDELRNSFSERKGKRGLCEASIEEDILELAAEIFGIDAGDLDRTSKPENTLGWDSFAHVALMLRVEQHFSVKLSARDILGVTHLGPLIDLVQARIVV